MTCPILTPIFILTQQVLKSRTIIHNKNLPYTPKMAKQNLAKLTKYTFQKCPKNLCYPKYDESNSLVSN